MSKTYSLEDYKNDILLFAKELCGVELKGYQKALLKGIQIDRAKEQDKVILFPNLNFNKKYGQTLRVVEMYIYFLRVFEEYLAYEDVFNSHVEVGIFKVE
ncbi:hypothetical protein QUF96_02370 [Bacillus bombysepticus]|nr:hypothetical protein [Bacillus bombysepticus]